MLLKANLYGLEYLYGLLANTHVESTMAITNLPLGIKDVCGISEGRSHVIFMENNSSSLFSHM